MTTLSIRSVISSISYDFPTCRSSTSCLSKGIVKVNRRGSIRNNGSHIISRSKRTSFQDFQGFAEPIRLLPATEATICTESTVEKMLASLKLDESCSFYMLQICTSREFGSSLRDLNSAILLSLVDVNGNSVLQRMPAVSSKHLVHEKETSVSEQIHFQRGSVETITFQGPKLSKIEAIWVGLESGSWRLGGLRLMVVSRCQSSQSSTGDLTGSLCRGLKYDFEECDILFGEGGGTSMTELRPQLATEFSVSDFSTFLGTYWSPPTSLSNSELSNEEGMKEYEDLKLSLLLYDFMLVSIGTTITTFFASDTAAYAFLAGGICGFLYLLQLQKSVDGLSTSSLISGEGNFENLVRGFKGPLSSLALILVAIAVVVKYELGSADMVLPPQYLLLGVAGFFTCKISVVLAAFRPMQSLKKEK